MFPPDLGPHHDGASDPVVKRKAGFVIAAFIAGSLTAQVVEELVAEADEIFIGQLPVGVVENGPLRREAGNFGNLFAPCAIGIGLDEGLTNRIKYIWRFTLVLVPGFKIRMPFG